MVNLYTCFCLCLTAHSIELTRLCINFANTVFVLLPMCVIVIRIGFIVRSHRLRLVADDDAVEATVDARNKELRATHRQLCILGAALLVLCVFWIYESVGNLRGACTSCLMTYAYGLTATNTIDGVLGCSELGRFFFDSNARPKYSVFPAKAG